MLLPVVVVMAAVAVFGGNQLLDTVTGWFTGGGTAFVGEGADRLMVASEAESDANECGVRSLLVDRRCGKLNVLVADARRMPFIARNTMQAWESGRPGILTMNRSRQAANRQAACGKFKRQYKQLSSCDEYPMAVTDEGGGSARAAEVPSRENLCQGGLYRPQYPADGERFLVVIANPDNIASSDFAGVDIAKNQGWC